MGDADESDDELIRRLHGAAGVNESVQRDRFMDLPLAEEVRVRGGDLSLRGEPSCQAEGRRRLAIHGAYGYPVTEQVRCELQAGHTGAHRARFVRSRFRRRWHALEWPAEA